MSLGSGTRLGPYEVVAPLGAGGMGEVYRARDTKLGRSVAIKVLPDELANDPDRSARFEREAKVLASLNHPHIATLFGMEEAAGRHFLVMELVEGETLAEQIACGPLAIEDVLKVALQIAEALEAAHEQGIIHRDLKPANVKITPDEKVKVLDFGLAKLVAPADVGAPSSGGSMSMSPTVTTPAMTRMGVIMGTAAYMSPEQAKGKPVDKRADIWAFGCVLYEMLTGKLAFEGTDVSETIASVIKSDVLWGALPAGTPRALQGLIERCLRKDTRLRMRDIGDVRVTLEELIARPEIEAPAPHTSLPASSARVGRRRLPWVVAATVVLVAAGGAVGALWSRPPASQPAMQFSAEIGVDASLMIDFGSSVVFSPDGKLVAFTAKPSTGGPQRLYLRRLDQLIATTLTGTEGAGDAFFSPDGQWIGFFAAGKLKKISVAGGAAVTVANAPDDRGGAWAEDGTIVFAQGAPGSVLQRVSSDGGTPEPLTSLDGEINHRWPQVLPGERAVLFTATVGEGANIVLQPLPTGPKKVLQRGGHYGRYVPSGHMLYVQDATLFAAPFDLDRLEVVAQPIPILKGVANATNRGAQYSLSETGSLVYVPGATGNDEFVVQWMERSGKTQPLQTTNARYGTFRFSPDGDRMAIDIYSQLPADIWMYELARDTMSRLTSDPAEDREPVFSPDGKTIAFASRRGDGTTPNLYWQRSDGTGNPQRLTDSRNSQFSSSWHVSGKFLAFGEQRPNTKTDILILPVEGDGASGWKSGKPWVFLESPFNEQEAIFSPDGNWLAYESDESGRDEIYVRPFPGPGGKWQISTAGGEFPLWSRNGKELFFRTADQRIWVATYAAVGNSFRAEKPRLWSEATLAERRSPRTRNFDLHPDGQRFAVLQTAQSPAASKVDKVVFVLNFFEQLRRMAPRPQR